MVFDFQMEKCGCGLPIRALEQGLRERDSRKLLTTV